MGRQRRGSGTARRRANGWECRVRFGDRQVSFFAATLEEAQRRAQEAKREHPVTLSRSPTVREWLAKWLTLRKRDLRSQTWLVYESQLRRHVLPVLGDVRLDHLRVEHISTASTQPWRGRSARRWPTTSVSPSRPPSPTRRSVAWL